MMEFFKKLRRGLFNWSLARESYWAMWFCTKVLRFSFADGEVKHYFLSPPNQIQLLSRFFPIFEEMAQRFRSLSAASQAAEAADESEVVLAPEPEPYTGPDGTLMLNQDSMSIVLSYLDLPEQQALSVTSKANYNSYNEAIIDAENFPLQAAWQQATPAERAQLRFQLQRIKVSHPPKFLAQMGGYAGIFRIPTIDVGEQMGSTDYLDFKINIRGPLRGFDKYGRAFYCSSAEMTVDGETYPVQFKVFQRYTDSEIWESVGNKTHAADIGERMLDLIRESRKRGSTAVGDDKARLGIRGLAFFARVINKQTASVPVVEAVDNPYDKYTRESQASDGDAFIPLRYQSAELPDEQAASSVPP